MFQRTKITAEMTQRLLDELTGGGERDLSQLRIDDLEAEVYELMDQVSMRVIRGVLEDQAEGCGVQQCPRCNGPLVDKPPEEKSLSAARGELTWKQPVKRCQSCRCDFFPSSEGHGD